MPATTTATGLGGAIAGRFVPSRAEVVLVELVGRLTTVDLATRAITQLGAAT